MKTFEISGNVTGTALRVARTEDGRLTMTAWVDGYTDSHDSVILRPEWLRPLAAWLAGEAEPGIAGHDEYGTPYGRWLAVSGDETAVVYSTHTRAELTCSLPFGAARVAVGPRNRLVRFVVMLSPEARVQVAAHLRRISAESWTAQNL